MAQNTAETFGVKTADRAGNDVEQMYNEAKDAALEGVERVKEAAIAGEDMLRNFIEKQPYTSTLIALGIGLLIGYAVHREPPPLPQRSWW